MNTLVELAENDGTLFGLVRSQSVLKYNFSRKDW